jgi:hypothetical protein
MTNRSTYLCTCLSVLSICLQSDLVLAKTPISKSISQPSKSSIEKRAAAKLAEWLKKYPNLKIYPLKLLKQQYPNGTICSTVQKTSFIVYVVFDKLPNNEEVGILGDNLGEGEIFLGGDMNTSANRKLSMIAKYSALEAAATTARNRPAADKDKPVLYQYLVKFDPTTCIK